MDARTFDSFTRKIAARMNRRRALATGGLGITTALMGHRAPAAVAQGATPVGGATPATGDTVDILFVQTFSSATIQADSSDPTAFTITLTDGTGQTVYFTDRPERLAGTITDEQFVDGRAFDPNDPPNAAIVSVTGEDSQAISIVELTEPTYDPGTGSVTYSARELDVQPEGDVVASLATRQTDTALEGSFGPVTLFIDQLACLPVETHCTQNSDCCSDFCCGDPLDCGAGTPHCE